MDCRSSLVPVLAVILGGCVPSSTISPTADKTSAAEMATSAVSKNRKPKPTTFVQMGQVQEQLAADQKCSPAQREQYLDTARKSYQEALTNDPKNQAALIALARLYNVRGDYTRAVTTYEKATKSYPKEAWIWYDLGMCQARHRKWEPAIQSLKVAVELDSENRQYSNSLGFALARAERYQEAFAVFKSVNNEPEAHINMARMLHHVQKDHLSKQHIEAALRLDPDLQAAKQLWMEIESSSTAAVPVGFEQQPEKSNN